MDQRYESDTIEQGVRTETQDVRLDTNTVIPVLREELLVGKEVRQTGTVRVKKTVHEIQELVRENLLSEKAQVTRVPKNEAIQSAPPIRTEGDEVIIPVVEEVLVVTKQLRLVEEIRISKSQVTTPYEEQVTLLGEEVTIERE